MPPALRSRSERRKVHASVIDPSLRCYRAIIVYILYGSESVAVYNLIKLFVVCSCRSEFSVRIRGKKKKKTSASAMGRYYYYYTVDYMICIYTMYTTGPCGICSNIRRYVRQLYIIYCKKPHHIRYDGRPCRNHIYFIQSHIYTIFGIR